MLNAENLNKFYGLHPAIQNVSLEAAAGEVVGFLGLNGAGKTTTLRILSGLLAPTSGRVEVCGVDLYQEPERAKLNIGFCPENPPLYREMTVESYLRFVAAIRKVGHKKDQAVERALEACDLSHVRRDRIDSLSHGYHRRIGLAQAIVHRPKVILLDEPTSGLDPQQVVQMRALIEDFRAEHTVVISSHVLSEIHALCDRLLVLHQGELVAQGSEEELSHTAKKSAQVHIEFQGDAALIEQALKELAIPRTKNVHGHQHRWLLELKADIEVADVADVVVQNSARLFELRPKTSELENIFLELTGQSASGGVQS